MVVSDQNLIKFWLRSNGVHWTFVDFFGVLLDFYGFYWTFMDFIGVQWSLMDNLGIPWNSSVHWSPLEWVGQCKVLLVALLHRSSPTADG
jgi:hypothetical protein